MWWYCWDTIPLVFACMPLHYELHIKIVKSYNMLSAQITNNIFIVYIILMIKYIRYKFVCINIGSWEICIVCIICMNKSVNSFKCCYGDIMWNSYALQEVYINILQFIAKQSIQSLSIWYLFYITVIQLHD